MAKTQEKLPKKKAGSKSKPKAQYVGWQETPIHQARFGGSTKGGRQSASVQLKHSGKENISVDQNWYVLDASQLPVGRLASVASTLLMGKHRATWTPGAGSGDGVIVINADRAFFSSNKAEKKIYYWHTQFMGGLKMETARQALQKHPERVIWEAVQGMMPKNKLSRYQIAHLKIYKGEEHPHKAQNPTPISLSGRKNLLKMISSIEAA